MAVMQMGLRIGLPCVTGGSFVQLSVTQTAHFCVTDKFARFWLRIISLALSLVIAFSLFSMLGSTPLMA